MAGIDQVSLGETTYELVPEIASLFDNTKEYDVGEYVIKDAALYRFKSAHAAGAWIGTDTEVITVVDELTNLKADVSVFDDELNDLLGYINYGYDTPESLPTDTSSHSRRIGIDRNCTKFILNGTTTTYNCYIKISNHINRSATVADIKAFTNPLVLESGHRYQARLEVLSGTYTSESETYLSPHVLVYKAGEATSIAEFITKTESECVVEFTTDSTNYHLCVCLQSGCSVTDLVCRVTLKDVTVGSVYDKIDALTVVEGSTWI